MKRNKCLLFLGSIFSLVLTGCDFIFPKKTEPTTNENGNNNQNEEPFSVNKDYLYGITDISFEEYTWSQIDYKFAHKLFSNLGVTSVRFWAHATEVLESPTKLHTKNYPIFREIFDDLKETNPYAQIIGMNHTNFHNEYRGEYNAEGNSAKPPRDTNPGSRYMRWLDDYETTWYTLVSAFPEIEYWEIDNECNNYDFMHRIGTEGIEFSIREMAAVYYDMSYRASLGIHRANPNAKTVMGGMVVWTSPTGSPQDWLDELYDYIELKETWPSNNPDDFFQIAAWHPYIPFPNDENYGFVKQCNAIYDVIKTREGKDKKVFLTEAGFSEHWTYSMNGKTYRYTEAMCAEQLKQMYACAESLYYVENLHYYRMWDEKLSQVGRYGLFTNPCELNPNTGNSLAKPKATAYSFQEVSGGNGSLTLYEDYLKNN